MTRYRHCVLGLILASSCPMQVTQAAVYKAPSAEPTAEEVVILELMNRFRADPHKEADLLIAQGKGNTRHRSLGQVDWEMFRKEMLALKPAPPLVFDLAALKAARNHSYYMIHNGLTHGEQKGKEGFTGESFAKRMKVAGFSGGPSGENCFAVAPSPEASHLGFVVDYGPGGPGGMQPGRGHRKNMISTRSNVVGPGAVPNSSRLSVTHNFGTIKARFAGGVIYTDANNNGRYDIGEGRGGVTIRSSDGKSSTTTWSSGAYTLKLASAGAVALEARFGDLIYRQQYPAGKDNVKFDWNIPATADLDRADALLAKLGDTSGDPSKDKRLFKKLVDLYALTRSLNLDPDRQGKIGSLTAAVSSELDQAMDAVRKAISSGDAKALTDALKDPKRTYRGTVVEIWFKEAEVVGKASQAVARAESVAKRDPKQIRSRDVRKLSTELTSRADQMATPDFQAELRSLVQRVESLL